MGGSLVEMLGQMFSSSPGSFLPPNLRILQRPLSIVSSGSPRNSQSPSSHIPASSGIFQKQVSARHLVQQPARGTARLSTPASRNSWTWKTDSLLTRGEMGSRNTSKPQVEEPSRFRKKMCQSLSPNLHHEETNKSRSRSDTQPFTELFSGRDGFRSPATTVTPAFEAATDFTVSIASRAGIPSIRSYKGARTKLFSVRYGFWSLARARNKAIAPAFEAASHFARTLCFRIG